MLVKLLNPTIELLESWVIILCGLVTTIYIYIYISKNPADTWALYTAHLSALTWHAHTHCMIHFTVKNRKERNTRTLSAADSGGKKEVEERKENEEKGKTSNGTWWSRPGGEAIKHLTHTDTHTRSLHVTHMSERRANPCWRLITQCLSHGEFGDFSL